MDFQTIVTSTAFVIIACCLTIFLIFRTWRWIYLVIILITAIAAGSTWSLWGAPANVKILLYNGLLVFLWTVVTSCRRKSSEEY
jgi:hypothetical protein